MNIIKQLTDDDDKKAFSFMKEIVAKSEQSAEYYPYFEDFAALLQDSKSYIRTRAFILCCSQARWDTEGKIEKIMPELMALLFDSKPTVVRQCLNAIKELIVFRSELRPQIRNAIDSMDIGQYKESMHPLIQNDIERVSEMMNEK